MAFLLNAASFFGVIFFLYRWKRHHEQVETGRVTDAMLTGLRFVRGAPVVRSILIRTGALAWQRVPCPPCCRFLARPHGATGYGLLLGSFGLGAWPGPQRYPGCAADCPWTDWWLFGTLLFAAMTSLPEASKHFLCFVWYCSQAGQHGSEFWHA